MPYTRFGVSSFLNTVDKLLKINIWLFEEFKHDLNSLPPMTLEFNMVNRKVAEEFDLRNTERFMSYLNNLCLLHGLFNSEYTRAKEMNKPEINNILVETDAEIYKLNKGLTPNTVL